MTQNKMPKQESLIQFQIVEAIKHYFRNAMAASNIAPARVHISLPSPAAQAKNAEEFGRKPYDIGFYVERTAVLFLEIKELEVQGPISGKFSEYKIDQQDMLVTVSDNGVDIRYAYNTWAFDRKVSIDEDLVLDLTHVREARKMKSPVQYQPVRPDAEPLRDYLDALLQDPRGAAKLVNLLDEDVSHFDYLNGMPLMILMNLDDEQAEVVIALDPKQSLRVMKELFTLPSCDRAAKSSRRRSSRRGLWK
ncbi:hypothetical protein [Variovorax gossypii]